MDKEYKDFIVEKILKVEQTKSVIAKANLVEGNIPYVTRTVSDNGYMGTCGNTDKVNKGNCITIGAETGVAFYQPVDFVAGNKVYRLSADGLNEKHYLFLAGALNRLTKNYSYSNARIPEKIKKERILLPIKTDENGNPIIDDTYFYHEEGFIPDFDYMQERIEELEQERIEELEQYLVATGLNDYELTDEDIEILSLSGFRHYEERDSEDVVKVCKDKEFIIGTLFDKPNLKWIADIKFDKSKDLSQEQTKEFDLPLVNAKNGNNGIMYFGRSADFLYVDGGIDIVNDGAISAGNVYPQPHMIGVLYNAYIITLKNDDYNTNRPVLEYLSCVIEKNIKHRFSYSDKAGWDKVKEITIPLPIKVDEENNPIIDTECKYHQDGYIPDWNFMEKYIKAIEKIVIADVVQYKDAMISKTKEVVA